MSGDDEPAPPDVQQRAAPQRPRKRRRRLLIAGVGTMVLLIVVGATSSGNKAHSPTSTSSIPPAHSARAVAKPKQAATAIRSAREKAECPGLEPGWKCTPQRAREEAEYQRRKAEGEHRLTEMHRRAKGELTPEEQEELQKDRQESQKEVEAIQEGHRIKNREEGNVP